MIIALWAFIAMIAEDIIGVANSQAMARNKANLAGLTDVFAFICVLVTNHYALNALNGHNMALTVVVIAAITAANYIGSWSGVKIGQRWIKPPLDPLSIQIADLTRRVAELERTK